MRVIGVIPARYGASRFPGKPLVDLDGKTMIQRVWEQAKAAKCLEQVIVATEDERIVKAVQAFGGKAMMTSPKHASGTDRVAEVALQNEADIVVNIQGDEPLIPPAMIDEVVRPFVKEAGLVMSTLRTLLVNKDDLNNPQTVKVVVDKNDFALYFSRSLIPFPRNGEPMVYKHIGLYAYKRDFLSVISKLTPTPLEKAESLEQLRVLENGYRIKTVQTRLNSVCVDTPEDAQKVRELIIRGSSSVS